MTLDVLAIGPHPDDADLGVGGTLLVHAARGMRVGILDLTRGELSSRGTVKERSAEAEESAKRLNLAVRENAGLPDGGVDNTDEQRRVVIPIIRRLRPRVILAPAPADRHPDHRAAHALVRDANFFAGVSRIDTGDAPYRTPEMWYYHPYFETDETPAAVINISDQFERKLEALSAFRSQFYNPDYPGPETYVASKAFWDAIETRAAYWGYRIGARYGEPLFREGPVGLEVLPLLNATTEGE